MGRSPHTKETQHSMTAWPQRQTQSSLLKAAAYDTDRAWARHCVQELLAAGHALP